MGPELSSLPRGQLPAPVRLVSVKAVSVGSG